MSEPMIIVDNVSIRFNLAKERVDTLKEYIIKRLKGQIQTEPFYALKDVSFSLNKGESLGIVGANGSGKSTVLKLISKIYKPTNGKIIVNGSIAPLIELGAGFDERLTASENIFLNGAILGFNHSFMQHHYDEILSFSELWEFEHVPLQNYSSGMKARLGFAIATVVKPEILIVDEVLSVGDFNFRKKCDNRIQELLSNGTTLILVSHSRKDITKLCKRAVWLDKGHIRASGNAEQVCDLYEESGF